MVSKKILMATSGVLVALNAHVLAQPTGLAARLEADSNFSRVDDGDSVVLDLRYATADNFLKRDVYQGFKFCYLHKVAADKFAKATRLLRQRKPGWKFRVFDCLRSRTMQKVMWEIVEHTAQEPYVSNPAKGNSHNYGLAIDASLLNEKGDPVDMGTPFDYFGPLAEPPREAEFLRAKKLTQEQINNRHLLRDVMREAGFEQLPTQWWHFDALPQKTVETLYKIVE